MNSINGLRASPPIIKGHVMIIHQEAVSREFKKDREQSVRLKSYQKLTNECYTIHVGML